MLSHPPEVFKSLLGAGPRCCRLQPRPSWKGSGCRLLLVPMTGLQQVKSSIIRLAGTRRIQLDQIVIYRLAKNTNESGRSWLSTVVILIIIKVVFFSDLVNKVLILKGDLVCRTHITGITVCVSAQSISRKSHKLASLQIRDIEFPHC